MLILQQGERWITSPKPYEFKSPRDRYFPILESYSEGGPTLNDGGLGLEGHIWHIFIDDRFGAGDVMLEREDTKSPVKLFSKTGIDQIDFSFDQNMRPFVTYVRMGRSYYYHFDAATSTYNEVALDKKIEFPRCEIDKRTLSELPESDIILGYVREGWLCFRVQRERYLQEHKIIQDVNKRMLWRVGHTTDGRFGFLWR